MIVYHNTPASQAYTEVQQKSVHQPTWQDVCDAYDQGLRHGLHCSGRQRQHLKNQLQALQMLNAPVPQEVDHGL